MEQTPGPYNSPRDTSDMYSEPTPSPLRTLGILNIVFSCLLLLCISCLGLYAAAVVAMQPMMQAAQNQIRAEQQKRIDELKQQFADSKDNTERAELQGQIDALERMPAPPIPDSRKMSGLDDPKVLGFYIADAASGFVLNILMLIVGCGLLGMREWARQGGVMLAAVKIVRLVVLYGIGIAVIAPIQGKASADGVVEMMKQVPNPQPVMPQGAQLATMYTVMLSGSFVATMIFGVVYPGISLWMLTRDGAKAATRRTISDPSS